ncbi:MAG: CPBP family intramembrane metalloprotease [Chloroflexi bacterium]|nr:CPBP family intramembrane metalloprotease [Chloroflexota bacterium]
MDFSLLLLTILALSYIGVVLYLANLRELRRVTVVTHPAVSLPDFEAQRSDARLRWLLYGIAAVNFVLSLFILQTALFSGMTTTLPDDMQLPPVDLPAALANFALGGAVTWLSVRLIASPAARERLRRWIGERGTYDPDSSVHTAGVVLSLTLLSITIGQLVLSGGLSGLAQNVELEGVSPGALVLQGVLMVAAAFLGVGLAIRRTLAQSLERLGLRLPTVADVTWGIGMGVLLYMALLVMATLWALVVPAEQIQQQNAAAEQIAQAFDTLPLALLLSATAAVSEEILFRGALQPVFGLGLTSVFFALVHMQYTLTPATIIIFVVALGLGWLRRRQSTTAAIIAHFVYNFIQLATAILLAGAAG